MNSQNVEGLTALHNSCCNGHIEVVKYLLANGADINIADEDGWTPLHGAACFGEYEVVQYLVQHGANLSAVNSDGQMPLILANDDSTRAFLNDCVQRKKTADVLVALYDHDPVEDDELRFHTGDRLTIIHEGDEDENWWFAELGEETGFVPQSYLTLDCIDF